MGRRSLNAYNWTTPSPLRTCIVQLCYIHPVGSYGMNTETVSRLKPHVPHKHKLRGVQVAPTQPKGDDVHFVQPWGRGGFILRGSYWVSKHKAERCHGRSGGSPIGRVREYVFSALCRPSVGLNLASVLWSLFCVCFGWGLSVGEAEGKEGILVTSRFSFGVYVVLADVNASLAERGAWGGVFIIYHSK